MCDINANGPPVGLLPSSEGLWKRRGSERGTEWGGEVYGGKVQVTTGERGAGRRGKIRGEKSRKTSRECRKVLRCEWLSAAKQREWEWEGGGGREKRDLSSRSAQTVTWGQRAEEIILCLFLFFSLCSKLIQLFSTLWLALETSGNICA